MKIRRFRDQNYEKLRASCVKRKQLFVDTQFPPTNVSLFLEQGRNSDIEWKRPKELHEEPQLFVEGASSNDVTQGILGNCWFVSACSALTHNQHLIDRVIPDAEKQEWSEKQPYAGIFRFRFWRFGEWVEVVIDDLLPTRHGKLLFARSKTPNEFWSALLEKAFAKLYGCYENLVGGHLSDALQDVSGGVVEAINVSKFTNTDPLSQKALLYQNMKQAFDNEALIVAAIAAKTKDEVEQTLTCGLVKGHAYAVTAIREVEVEAKSTGGLSFYLFGASGTQQLIRLQNPWGEKEWNGPWSDDSKEWEQVSESQKKSLGITVDEDGEFWMPWDSFVQYFTDISICQLFNTRFFTLQKRYHEEIFLDEWTTNGAKSGAPNDMAGGCLNFSATFCNNPQYLFTISKPDTEVMFALTQRDLNEGQKRRDPYVTIGMHAMKVENNRLHRVHQPMQPVGTSDYANARSVFLHLRGLSEGRYILLPTTFAPREQTSFMLRIYSDEDIKPKSLKKHAPSLGFCGCNSASSVTRIIIQGVELRERSEKDVYCILRKRKTKVRTSTVKSTTKPQYNEQFVFHGSSKDEPYILEVWENRTLAKDKSIGDATFRVQIDNDNRELTLELRENGEIDPKGQAKLSISAFDDPMYL